jgi:type I restriction enzyme S subunit
VSVVTDELPEGWAETTLREIVACSTKKVEPGEDDKAPYLSLEHIESNSCRILGHGRGADVKSTKNVFRAGDILYGKLRPYLNKVCRPDFDGMCSTDILVLQPTMALDPGFLFQILSSTHMVAHAVANSSGINLPRTSFTALGEFQLGLPPLPEQRRIVAKLEALRARSRKAREALEAIPSLLEQFRRSVLVAAFRGDLTADWRERHPDAEPGSVLLERIRAERRSRWEKAELAKFKAKGKVPKDDSWKDRYVEPAPVLDADLPELPESWCWASVGEITDNHDSIRIPLKISDRDKRSGPYPYYGAFGVIDDIDEYLFDGEYLLLAEDGKNLLERRRPISLIACGKFWVNNHAHVLTATGGTPLRYLMHFFNSPSLDLNGHLTGIDQVKLTRAAMDSIPIPLSPLGEQAAIVQLCNSAVAALNSQFVLLRGLAEALEQLDQSALAKAFRGELVPQDPNDEPASMLMERIQAERADDINGTPARRGRKRSSETTAEAAADNDKCPVASNGKPLPAAASRRPAATTVHKQRGL